MALSDPILFALFVATAAGLATGVGAAFATLTSRARPKIVAIGLGFSAGAMLWVSFVELWPLASDARPTWLAPVCFFAGIAIAGLIDAVLPSHRNPHETVIAPAQPETGDPALRRVGILVAIALALHNFPEGAATFFTTLHDRALGISTGIAVALHNVPEGIAVALPIYHATGSRMKALGLATLSGIAEPVGGLVAFGIVGDRTAAGGDAPILAAVAGIMVFISVDQLLPNARRYAPGHQTVYGLVAGMALVAAALLAVDVL